MRAVTLGPAGTYAHRVATAVAAEVTFRQSVTAIVDAVASGAFDRGVIPIENSIEGSVTESLDALERYEVAVVGELIAPIRHALLSQGDPPAQIASHPQALAQCRQFLEERYPTVDQTATASTAAAVELARDDETIAAIAHPESVSGALRLLATDIQDRDTNETRFFLITDEAHRVDSGEKTSLIVYPNDDHPGLLLALLQPFAERSINLSRIESRPSGKHLGDYLFHLDLEGDLIDDTTLEALDALQSAIPDGWVKVLGSYDVTRL